MFLLENKKNRVQLVQKESFAFADLALRDDGDISSFIIYPEGRTALIYYKFDEEDADTAEQSQFESYWMLIILPSSIESESATMQEWLDQTNFNDDYQEDFNEWIGSRTEEDDYSVAIIEMRDGMFKDEFFFKNVTGLEPPNCKKIYKLKSGS